MKDDLLAPRIFLSYAKLDEQKVDLLYKELTSAGLQPWMDIYDIEPGSNWKREILKHIRDSTFFLACLSNYSVKKHGLIQVELKEALDVWREKLEDDIFLIPVRLEECPVPESLSRFQWVDSFTKKGKELLIKTLVTRSEKMGFLINQVNITEKTREDYLREYLDKINLYKRPRLLVEGINTDIDNIKSQIQHGFGINYWNDILVPEGRRCIFFLEYKSWQGNNGSEDISDLIIDFLAFDRRYFDKAIQYCKENEGFYYSFHGQRIRDDGFWEDGLPSFRYTNLENIPIKILIDLDNNQFHINYEAKIEPNLHPQKVYVSSAENIF